MIRSSSNEIFKGDEISAMVKASPCLWWKAFVELAICTGLRVSEILRLHCSDLDERTLCVRITSDPTDSCGDGEHVSLRRWMPPHRERIVPVTLAAMQTLTRFQSERLSDSYVFVPDWKLAQLWTRIVADESLTSEQLSPGLNQWFRMIQRRAHLVLAKDQGVPVSNVKWKPRSLRVLRTTAINRLADRLQPSQLAAHLGYPDIRPVLHFYDRAAMNAAGRLQT